MLVLVATNELQGAVDDDYSWTVEGELVTPLVVECTSGERCGCARGFPGLASAKATTTAMVVDRPGVGEPDLREAVYDWLDRGGWIDLLEQSAADRSMAAGHDGSLTIGDLDEVDDMIESVIDEHVAAIQDVCAAFGEGTVLTRHGRVVAARTAHPFAA